MWYGMWKNYTKPLDSIEYLDLIGLSTYFYRTMADAIKVRATQQPAVLNVHLVF